MENMLIWETIYTFRQSLVLFGSKPRSFFGIIKKMTLFNTYIFYRNTSRRNCIFLMAVLKCLCAEV